MEAAGGSGEEPVPPSGERKILRLVLGSIDELLGPTVTKKVAHEVNKRLKRKKKKA